MSNMKKILGSIHKADLDYNMIEENDRIAVGVSGGKDSMLLLYCLHLYQKLCERRGQKKFQVIGIHIKMGFANMDFNKAIAFFEKNDIEFHCVESKLYDILKIQANEDGTLKCSLCSTLKKGAVNRAAHDYSCNKVAFAHHSDDAVETLLMNAIYGGRLATFAPKMELSNSHITFIRPFVYARESQIVSAVQESAIPIVPSTCPMDGHTKRQDMKEMLAKLYQQYPSAKDNFLLMLHNEKQLSLWKKQNLTQENEENEENRVILG